MRKQAEESTRTEEISRRGEPEEALEGCSGGYHSGTSIKNFTEEGKFMANKRKLSRAKAGKEIEGLDTQTFLAAIVESSDDAIYGKTLEGAILSWNHGAERMYGYSAEEIVGRPVSVLVPPTSADEVPQILERVKRGERVDHFETARVRKDGQLIDVSLTVSPIRDASGKIIGASTTAREITEQKRLREALTVRAKEILDVSTPVLQVWEGVVVAPFIGTLDTQRAQQFMERLLDKIVATNSSVALLDVTGVPAIDTRTAQHLIETITSVRLLGAQAVLTGVRPAIAQTLAHLGINLADVVTRSSLAAGLRVALDVLHLKISSQDDEA
jgi:PAS domain S-box-containing protein